MRGLLDSYWKENIANSKALEGGFKGDKKLWGYSFGKDDNNYLLFKNIDLGRKIRPSCFNSELSEIHLKLGIRLNGTTNKKEIVSITDLGVNISIGGYYYTDDTLTEKKNVISCFHLDKDAPTRAKDANFTHPLYHLNFGGIDMTKRRTDADNEGEYWDFGSLFLLETPRLVHHPMDVILAIDFVLRNFYKEEKHQKITEKKGYKVLLKKASKRFLYPYYQSIMSCWENEEDCDYVPSSLVPHLNF